ncbi:hypothetical protein DL96DRAFT_1711795 [Flagelloscypha sp. PMI_526]|nr:hypothetical protein DL96DRAFT_1711795 [Flagelloscypha sp. PMI_526]
MRPSIIRDHLHGFVLSLGQQVALLAILLVFIVPLAARKIHRDLHRKSFMLLLWQRDFGIPRGENPALFFREGFFAFTSLLTYVFFLAFSASTIIRGTSVVWPPVMIITSGIFELLANRLRTVRNLRTRVDELGKQVAELDQRQKRMDEVAEKLGIWSFQPATQEELLSTDRRIPLSRQECRLPAELILLVAEHAYRSDLSSLMLVCKDLHQHASSIFFDPLVVTGPMFWRLYQHLNRSRGSFAYTQLLGSLIFTCEEVHPHEDRPSMMVFFPANTFRRVAFDASLIHHDEIILTLRPQELSLRRSGPREPFPLSPSYWEGVTRLCLSLAVIVDPTNTDVLPWQSLSSISNLELLLLEDDITGGCGSSSVVSYRLDELLLTFLNVATMEKCGWGLLDPSSKKAVEEFVIDKLNFEMRRKVQFVEMFQSESGKARPFGTWHMRWLDQVWEDLQTKT